MRPFITILILTFSYLTTYGQKYSKIVSDTCIVDFMTWLFNSDTSFHSIRHVDNDIVKMHSNDFLYADSTTLSNYLYANNIFKNLNGLRNYFDEKDVKYFSEQIDNQRKIKWQLKIKAIKLYDTVQLTNNQVDRVLYSYSLPIFSLKRDYVIIIEAFYCGLVCGGGDYVVYERQANNSWKRFRQFNHWEE